MVFSSGFLRRLLGRGPARDAVAGPVAAAVVSAVAGAESSRTESAQDSLSGDDASSVGASLVEGVRQAEAMDQAVVEAPSGSSSGDGSTIPASHYGEVAASCASAGGSSGGSSGCGGSAG